MRPRSRGMSPYELSSDVSPADGRELARRLVRLALREMTSAKPPRQVADAIVRQGLSLLGVSRAAVESAQRVTSRVADCRTDSQKGEKDA